MNAKDTGISSIFLNQSFDKKRLKALIYFLLKSSGEHEALRVVDTLKEIGFRYATHAGISIGLHDLVTPHTKPSLVLKAQSSMKRSEQDFDSAQITVTERSQRIIDTWHRTSELLRKQVVDHFSENDPWNPVYIMALSGARGNFSQVRQLVGMRGLMANQQGQIVSFPIRSNLREGLTLTEYFISCSGARKGLVDTALRTADTGYLTRRLVDVSHHIVVKKVRCTTNRGITIKALHSYSKTHLSLKERLVGRTLAENIVCNKDTTFNKDLESNAHNPPIHRSAGPKGNDLLNDGKSQTRASEGQHLPPTHCIDLEQSQGVVIASPSILLDPMDQETGKPRPTKGAVTAIDNLDISRTEGSLPSCTEDSVVCCVARRDQEISSQLALEISLLRKQVYIRSPLTCAFTDSVCQLCYGWSMTHFRLVPLGDAVGVIAAQSIGEPGTQLTMRTFHTGGVFSGELLEEVHAPDAGKITFPEAFQGVLIRSVQGRIAFLTKVPGEFLLTRFKSDRYSEHNAKSAQKNTNIGNKGARGGNSEREIGNETISIPFQALSTIFIRHGETVERNQLLAEFSSIPQEENESVKSRQTLFSQFTGRVIEEKGALRKSDKPPKFDIFDRWLRPESDDDSEDEDQDFDDQDVENYEYDDGYDEYNYYEHCYEGSNDYVYQDMPDEEEQEVIDPRYEPPEVHFAGLIEPTKADHLGFFTVLAAQVGATLTRKNIAPSLRHQSPRLPGFVRTLPNWSNASTRHLPAQTSRTQITSRLSFRDRRDVNDARVISVSDSMQTIQARSQRLGAYEHPSTPFVMPKKRIKVRKHRVFKLFPIRPRPKKKLILGKILWKNRKAQHCKHCFDIVREEQQFTFWARPKALAPPLKIKAKISMIYNWECKIRAEKSKIAEFKIKNQEHETHMWESKIFTWESNIREEECNLRHERSKIDAEINKIYVAQSKVLNEYKKWYLWGNAFNKKYRHPEIWRTHRFCLQTVAEHGDFVDETYNEHASPFHK